ncbi:MAG: HEAT repeat domain-containing protein [Candidatus Jordarchaeaceae archaeon]
MEKKKDIKSLINMLKYSRESELREKAAEALGKIGNTEAVESLIQALNDKDNNVKAKAATALGRIKDKRVIKPLIQILKRKHRKKKHYDKYDKDREFWLDDEYDENSEVWLDALLALENIGGREVIESLTEALENLDKEVQESVKETLRELREKDMLNTLKKSLANTNFKMGTPDHLDEALYLYPLKKKHSRFYLPINVKLDLDADIISLYCELWCGLHGVGGGKTVKGIANWLRKYAEQIKKDEQTLLSLGFQLKDKNINGVHYHNFYYQKDYHPENIDELIKDLKKVAEEIY